MPNLFSHIRRIPSWLLWGLGLMLAAGYVYLFYHFFIGSLSIRWQAIYGSVPEPSSELYPVRGIDISHYQSQIDWKKLNEASIRQRLVSFVFIKATQGTHFTDHAFDDNFRQARDNGYIRGAYHYFEPRVDALKQAEFFISKVELLPGDLPPVLDVEETGSLSKEELQRAVRTWLYRVEQEYGVPPIIYTGFNFRNTYLDDPSFSRYPYWIAHYYRSDLRHDGEWAFWQYNDCGVLDGIKGSVDFDVFNGDINRLRSMTIPEPASKEASSEIYDIDSLDAFQIREAIEDEDDTLFVE